MAELPVREMVLYKHGVGFFVREGTVNAEQVALAFRQDEINDVLKSLAVFDRAGGQVLGIHYQTPMDKDARLANSSIRLGETDSLHDLLRDLRGRRASLIFETTPGSLETITGRVIGLDQRNQRQIQLGMPAIQDMVSILTDDGQVKMFLLETLRSLQILDTQSEHDLSYFLDTSVGDDNRRTVNLRLSAGEHQLVVYYVAPSPTWRVSYRLVAETDTGKESGRALLQGWGLFDNRLEEDLENVQVTLVAGQPISFIYDLYASRIPQRPTIQDEARVAPGPVEFAGARLRDEEDHFSDVSLAGAAFAAPAPAPRMLAMQSISREKMAKAAPPAAKAKEAAEFFQYIVTAPVSVKRGESALVPIIGSDISYERELLYNGAKLPDHPVAALRFINSTGLTLERGPITVVENSDYKGEAVVAFTKDGNQVYLPYAVELGVHVTERPERSTRTRGLSIKESYLIYEEYQISSVTYILENTTAKPLTITIEAAVADHFELFDTPAPILETAAERRWHVDVPARGKAEFTRNERWLNVRHEELRKLDYQKLKQFMENRWLDQTTLDQLSEILSGLGHVQQWRSQITKLETERSLIYKEQDQIRANLNTLQPTGDEAVLRKRVLGQLEAKQNRLEALEQQINNLAQQIEQTEVKVQQIIAVLG
jgi:hypothetical protein